MHSQTSFFSVEKGIWLQSFIQDWPVLSQKYDEGQLHWRGFPKGKAGRAFLTKEQSKLQDSEKVFKTKGFSQTGRTVA